jgi:hypothetical protein
MPLAVDLESEKENEAPRLKALWLIPKLKLVVSVIVTD